MKRFERKTALVTGVSSGIGLATAQAFVAEGARERARRSLELPMPGDRARSRSRRT